MSSLFSLHRFNLNLLIAGQRQGPSPSASINSGNEAGYRDDEQKKREDEEKKREGRVALDVTTAIFDSNQAAEYDNATATCWDLYSSEANINDKDLVESLEGDTKSMELVVSLGAPPI